MADRGGLIGSKSRQVCESCKRLPGRLLQFPKKVRPHSIWSKKRVLLVAILVVLVLGMAVVGLVYWKAASALKAAQKELTAEREHTFAVVRLEPPADSSFNWVSAPAAFSGAAMFQGRMYVCGSAGLFAYDSAGKLLKHYRVGQELPPSPLLRMAVGTVADAKEPELLIVTASEGLLEFDGNTFRQIRPSDAADRTITSILPLRSRQLLIGTRKHGVLVYDGKSLRQFHPSLANIDVTELAGTGSDLWVGTMDQGVVHWIAGRAEKFSEPEGLPDKQVFSIALNGNRAYVGTAVGVAEFDGGEFKRVVAPGAFARTIYIRGSKLLIGGLESGVNEIDLQAEARRADLPPVMPVPANLQDIEQITASDDVLLAVTPGNVYSYAKASEGGWRPLLSTSSGLLSDRNISSLAVDPSGRLWVGYFDHGLDLLAPGLRSVTHIEDQHVYCVNRILIDDQNPPVLADQKENQKKDKNVVVATANGLVLFDRWGKELQVLGRAQGLIADHVTDVARYGDGLVVATPAGLTFLDRSGARSLYAFHGLVNNHVYSVATSGGEVLAGTLGGLSLLEGERVVSNFTVTSPGFENAAGHKLPHNWISAVARSGDGWIIGTYGGGLVGLTQAGRFEDFEVGTGNFEVYPNALVTTPGHVLAGTLGRGLYSFNRSTNRWSVITDGLPSMTVTALAAGNGTIYVGTDNGLVRISEQSLP